MDDYHLQERKKAYETILFKLFLERMTNMGAEIYMDGKKVCTEDAAIKVVCEDDNYMGDYVLGENGKLEQVRFDKISLF